VPAEPPNNFAKQLSLYTHILILTADVAANLMGPVVTVEAGLEVVAAVAVSMVFAVM
jgi:hypothetical protein